MARVPPLLRVILTGGQKCNQFSTNLLVTRFQQHMFHVCRELPLRPTDVPSVVLQIYEM
jgi:hypothetical protein